MQKGPIVTIVVSLLAMTGVAYTFLNGASPYVTVAQARHTSSDRVHLMGTLVKDSVSTDLAHHALTFRLRDPEGSEVLIKHVGEIPGNLSEATKVVAIGAMRNDVFVSEQLLLKCPSKYETEKKPSANIAGANSQG